MKWGIHLDYGSGEDDPVHSHPGGGIVVRRVGRRGL